MPRPMIFTHRNENVLIDVERAGQPLREDVHDVVVAVGSIVEFETKGALPLLRLKNMVSVWGMKYETFKVEFADAANLWSGLKGRVQVVAYAIRSFQKTHFGVEVGTDLPSLREYLEPVGVVVSSRANICLSRGDARRSRLRSITVHGQMVEKH